MSTTTELKGTIRGLSLFVPCCSLFCISSLAIYTPACAINLCTINTTLKGPGEGGADYPVVLNLQCSNNTLNHHGCLVLELLLLVA